MITLYHWDLPQYEVLLLLFNSIDLLLNNAPKLVFQLHFNDNNFDCYE